ncbi:MAG: RNA polymerase sigma-70 factor [Prevotella sp.]|nr:RNA polymerase sigma-70 factor [Prevotella sp.]MBR1464677.1 RNA polymerase sigma-70 factor [Prevotella sp.]
MYKTEVFNRLYRQYYEQLYFFARQYVDDEDTCHDIVTSIFEDVWKDIERIAQFKPDAIKTYLYTTTRNRCMNKLRHDKVHQRYVDFCMHLSSYAENPDKLMEMEEMEREMDRRIDELGPPTREIFIACYVDRKRYKEVASEMGISVSTVRKHITKALKFFSAKYKKG